MKSNNSPELHAKLHQDRGAPEGGSEPVETSSESQDSAAATALAQSPDGTNQPSTDDADADLDALSWNTSIESDTNAGDASQDANKNDSESEFLDEFQNYVVTPARRNVSQDGSPAET
ncbi:MAG: hypothetical protein AAFP69_13495 [Planctomycetota bacterium]